MEIYLQLLKKHQEELLKGEVIEGPLASEHGTGWMSNLVITGKSWVNTKIRMNIDTRLMMDIVKHHPVNILGMFQRF